MSVSGEEPRPLGGDARSILDAGRSAERLSLERKAQLRGRVMAAVGAGVGAAAVAGAAEAAAAKAGAAAVAKTAGLSLFAKIGLSVAVVTLGAGGLLWSRAQSGSGTEGQPAAAALSATASAGAAPVHAPGSAEASAQVAPGETAEPALAAPSATATPRRVATASSVASGAASSEPAPADPMEEETKLLVAAHAELARGNAGGALALLDQHATRFPRGALAPERRAARAMALCKAGRADEGRLEAEALYGKDSKSPLAQKINRACGGK